jgi:beta-galactosidase
VIVSPFLSCLDECGLRERLEAWIEAGGVWIAGPGTDKRNSDGAKFRHSFFGCLEEWGGVYCKEEFPGTPKNFKLRWGDGIEDEGALGFDGFELRGAEALATYTENELEGLAAATVHTMGKGKVILLGTAPTPERLTQIIGRFAPEVDVMPVAEASENLLVVPRAGEGGDGAILVELDNQPATWTVPRSGTNLLTGEAVAGTLELPAYGVAVVRYDSLNDVNLAGHIQ